ncbi:hypothetical protein SAMN05216223_102504 [Actinacidiphila yanglinensis]|uniref:Integral membrane protein n=1 Tax=Actinacidiphila yanglinensis TaxID=310779 RepID=A0A1H5W1F8_9ACTN|nr:DUF6114 domain-containing protein [Actinacidiphila yanglinensis]SEF92637.1 hypothetical protein SAMN05216223_102504 [Actinacidiphila yanglinensis]
MSAESTGLRARFRYGRLAFRHWRWQRPFWAGLLTLLSGVPIAYFPYADLTLGQLTVRMSTSTGSASLIIGVLLFTLGLTMWFQAAVRIFAGVASILLALVSLPKSNVGGFVIGFLLALLGGALAVSWAPGVPATDDPGEKAELPDGDPAPAGEDQDTPAATRPGGLFLPAQDRGDDRARPEEPALAGGRPDEETTKENGRHRAG